MCNHLHLDCPPGLESYKMRPIQDNMQPTKQFPAIQDQHIPYSAPVRPLQFAGIGPRSGYEAHNVQRTPYASVPALSEYPYGPPPAQIPPGWILPLPIPWYLCTNVIKGYRPELVHVDSDRNRDIDGFATPLRGRGLTRDLEPSPRRRSISFMPNLGSPRYRRSPSFPRRVEIDNSGIYTEPYPDPAEASTVAPYPLQSGSGAVETSTITQNPLQSGSGELFEDASRVAYSHHGGTYSASPNGEVATPPHSNESITANKEQSPLLDPSSEKLNLSHNIGREAVYEHLSGIPFYIRQVLEMCTHYDPPEFNRSGGTVEYELVLQQTYIDRSLPLDVLGVFRDRHTANLEAAKDFVHRFWRQIMVDEQEYGCIVGESGMLRLEINTSDPSDTRGMVSVFVRMKR